MRTLLYVLCGLFAALGTSNARADLLRPVVVVDAPETFTGLVDDTQPGLAVVGGALNNWEVFIVQGAFAGGAAADDILVLARHTVAPHPGEPAPNAWMVGAIQNVVPGAFPPRFHTRLLGHGFHADNMLLLYVPLFGGGSVLGVMIDHGAVTVVNESLPFPPHTDSITPTISWTGNSIETLCFGDGLETTCPCGNDGSAGSGCANSTGEGASLIALGSESVAANDMRLVAVDVLPAQPVLFFQGNTIVDGGLLFGDGVRCAATQVVRLEVGLPSLQEIAFTTASVAGLGGVSPGDSRAYQAWYRDPQAPPCGSGFNLSNALRLTWQP